MSRKLGRLGEETSLAKDTQGAPERRSKGGGILGRLRGHMIAGILVTAPVAITLYLALLFLGFVDSQVTPLIPSAPMNRWRISGPTAARGVLGVVTVPPSGNIAVTEMHKSSMLPQRLEI